MKYEPSLDGLRAVSILAVVIYHISGDYMPGGWAGVDVFFVLSGYLITRILRNEYETTGQIGFKRFYISRFLRLGPALLALIFVELFLAVISDQYIDRLRAIAFSMFYIMNWNRAFDWYSQWNLGHTWSLSMEEQFYFLWPVLFLFLAKKRPAFVLSIIVCSVFAWRIYLVVTGAGAERTYNGFDTHSDGLLLGCLVALTPRASIVPIAAKTVLFPLIALLLVSLFLPFNSSLTQSIGLSLTAFLAAWMVVAFEGSSWVKNLFSRPAFSFTGKISYGWYLWHFPIVLFVKSHIWIHGFFRTAALIALTYLVAVLSYFFIESPFLRIKDKIKLHHEHRTRSINSDSLAFAAERNAS